MEPVDGDQVYAAERLLGQRTRAGKHEYLVKWKGWSAKHNTWEPVDNILDERLIQEFADRQANEKAARTSGGSKRKSSGVTPLTAKKDSPEASLALPAKRGRRSLRTIVDANSHATSPSTSVGTRRSGRAAKPKQSLDESAIDEEEESEYGESESELSTSRKRKFPGAASSNTSKTTPLKKIERTPLGTSPALKIRRVNPTTTDDEDEDEDDDDDDDDEEETVVKAEKKNISGNYVDEKKNEAAAGGKSETIKGKNVTNSNKVNIKTDVIEKQKPKLVDSIKLNSIQLESSADESTETDSEDNITTTTTTTTTSNSAQNDETKTLSSSEVDDDIPPVEIYEHAWIRDNVYAAQALWAMYRAYQKGADNDEDLAKAHELGLSCVKTMQSLMECMMRQVDKVELFKKHQRCRDSLHAKYSVRTKSEVVGDMDWGHLQIDAVSLYLLLLAQMTASGLQIVRNFDEVAFIQNLVYYIETGYKTPDFGVWERGDKTNQGIRELNASSIGMAKAALQALNDVGDLFGDGSKSSVIHVMPDEIQQCSAVLSSMLPRESFSKETDAALLSIISCPAFAVEDPELVQLTRSTILSTLYGRYGCRRFLRDGYKNALEDPNRLYYINAELQKFENIECEWPVFICCLLLDAMFCGDKKAISDYWEQLNSIVILVPAAPKYNFIQLVPELYKVPIDKVELERNNHGSQDRIPAGTSPFLWAQSLYVICCLLHDGYLSPAELDPLSRRLSVTEKRPLCEVQVVILAETIDVQQELAANDIYVQMINEIDPIFSIQPASVLAKILNKVGSSMKLNLTGRPLDRDVELLSTSRLYHLGNKFVSFMPQFMDRRRSHLMYDIRILMDEWSSELQYIYTSWNSVSISGRPLVVLLVSKNMLQTDLPLPSVNPKVLRRQKSTVLGAIKKIKNGYIGGARVVMKNISEFFRTTSVSNLQVSSIEELFDSEGISLPRSLKSIDMNESVDGTPVALRRVDSINDRWSRQFREIHQASMRHRSIILDSNDSDLRKLRLAHANNEEKSTLPLMSSAIMEKSELSNTTSSAHLHTSYSSSLMENSPVNNDSNSKVHHSHLEGLKVEEVVDMLAETTIFDEQASLVHFLWLKFGLNFDTNLNNVSGVTVRILIEEIYLKACECRDWAWVRLMAGLLGKQLDDLSKAVTHLLVRQKQITVGKPSKNSEEAITCPKTKEELREIFDRCYRDDPNSLILAQELIISMGSLVRTEPRLFEEVFRLRISLIIQILASELSRLQNLSADAASQKLLSVSPFDLKCMLFSLLSGRLLEDVGIDDDNTGKEMRTGMGSFRKQIEERKSMRKSMRMRIDAGRLPLVVKEEASDSETDISATEEFQFGIWLRHRRIDGALNRVPAEFYEKLWDTVRLFSHGILIDRAILHRSLTQEMTRREIKFALQVEQLLNLIAEPEYREIVIEALTLLGGNLERLLMAKPQIPKTGAFEVEQAVRRANDLFVEHNQTMGTIVMECCGSGNKCDGARGVCKHFYDSAPAGEYGTSHYLIRALMDIFAPN